ncbi:ACP S-malonyltransferase [Caenibacillus caldisaponilyticus]|uniref:ACP S-malonyltransferase n=1 Tax=Caenibacillus caldisaponilyticus TaxID=1674942 RepID=UPI0009888484|nr:ACP S-malonyltransferase [Caenibacillus caldisaponilyticus]
MGKIAFVFPGQGSQAVGMAQDVAGRFPEIKALFDKADARLGYQLSDIIFNGPAETLTLTENAQPAILTASVAMLSLLEKEGLVPDYVAGHSLGEYSALVAAGALAFEDAVYAVRMRGLYMEEAVPAGTGAMAAVLGLDAARLAEVCDEVSRSGDLVQLANLNSPGQIAISGTKAGVEKASAAAKEAGAKRVIPLNVSGPFHSELMKPAAEKLKAVLEAIAIADARVPVVANVTADLVTDRGMIKELLLRQIYSPVRWIESVEKLVALGVDTFVEVGPGKVLAGLIKKIERSARVLNVNDYESFEKTVADLKGGSGA